MLILIVQTWKSAVFLDGQKLLHIADLDFSHFQIVQHQLHCTSHHKLISPSFSKYHSGICEEKRAAVMEFQDKYLVDNNRLWGAEEMKSFSMKYSIPVFQKMLLGEQHFKYYTIIQVIMQVIEQIGNFVTSRFNVFWLILWLCTYWLAY